MDESVRVATWSPMRVRSLDIGHLLFLRQSQLVFSRSVAFSVLSFAVPQCVWSVVFSRGLLDAYATFTASYAFSLCHAAASAWSLRVTNAITACRLSLVTQTFRTIQRIASLPISQNSRSKIRFIVRQVAPYKVQQNG